MRKWVRSPEMRAPQWRVIAAVSTGLSFRFVTQKTMKAGAQGSSAGPVRTRPLVGICCGFERVQMRCPGWGDVTDISRHDGHSVHQCGGGEEAIDVRQGIDNAEPSPSIRHRAIHVHDTIPEPGTGSVQPGAQSDGGARVAAGYTFGTAPQFPQCQDAQEQFLGFALPKPGGDELVGAITLAQLGNHIRVEEILHSSTGRGPERAWSKSASSPTSGSARR